MFVCKIPAEMGIGNRLKCIVSFLHYYNNPEEIILYWPIEGWVTTRFSDLFDFDIKTKITEINDLSVLENIENDTSFCSWRLYVKKSERSFLLFLNNDPFDRKKYRVDFLYNKTPKNILNIYEPYFMNLKPSKNVLKIIDNINVTEDMIAVQIRDNKDWTSWGRSSYVEDFIKEMKKYPVTQKFFLSAMNKDISEKVKKVFGEQIVEIPNKNYLSMEHSVADLFLLSIPQKSLCSCGSTFYEVAWWLNKKHPMTKVVGDYNNWKLFDKKILILNCNSEKKSTLLQRIFSVKNSSNRSHKVMTILGIKVKIAIKK